MRMRSPRWSGSRSLVESRIAEFNSIDLNVSQDSPCFAGFDPLPLLE